VESKNPVFVERSSTIERYRQPPPQIWTRLSALHRAHARAILPARYIAGAYFRQFFLNISKLQVLMYFSDIFFSTPHMFFQTIFG
jgi:hypothetical protein